MRLIELTKIGKDDNKRNGNPSGDYDDYDYSAMIKRSMEEDDFFDEDPYGISRFEQGETLGKNQTNRNIPNKAQNNKNTSSKNTSSKNTSSKKTLSKKKNLANQSGKLSVLVYYQKNCVDYMNIVGQKNMCIKRNIAISPPTLPVVYYSLSE